MPDACDDWSISHRELRGAELSDLNSISPGIQIDKASCEKPMDHKMELNDLSYKVIKAAITVHKELGPGLLESVYHRCMLIELRNLGLIVDSEVALPVYYRGSLIQDDGLRIDLLVEDRIIVEFKSVQETYFSVLSDSSVREKKR